MAESSLKTRSVGAALDAVTSISCVAYWVGVWSLFDAFKVDKVISGVIASVIIFILAVSASEQWLDKRSATWHPVATNVSAWFWTGLLAVLSLLVWRFAWFFVDENAFDEDLLQDNDELLKEHAQLLKEHYELHQGSPGWSQMSSIHAVVIAVVGAGILIATGRFRSCSHACPIGIVADVTASESRVVQGCFAQPAFSGEKITDVLLDFVLTIPVVLVWAGVWMLNDNANVHPLGSAIVCCSVVALSAIGNIDEFLRNAFAGQSLLVHHVGDIVFTSFLTLLVVGVWRGIWEVIDHNLHLAKHPLWAAGIALAGATGLTLLQRHRSACFPPVDFSVDDGDHFATVGHTEPESLLSEAHHTEKFAAEKGAYDAT
jgi:hypothetical protein